MGALDRVGGGVGAGSGVGGFGGRGRGGGGLNCFFDPCSSWVVAPVLCLVCGH